MKVYSRASQVVLVVKNLLASAGDERDVGSVPELGRSPGGGHGNPSRYSCVENSMDRGVWWATVHKVAKSQTRLERLGTYTVEPGLTSNSHSVLFPSLCPWPQFFKTSRWLEPVKGSDHGHLVDYILINPLDRAWAPRLLASPLLFY